MFVGEGGDVNIDVSNDLLRKQITIIEAGHSLSTDNLNVLIFC